MLTELVTRVKPCKIREKRPQMVGLAYSNKKTGNNKYENLHGRLQQSGMNSRVTFDSWERDCLAERREIGKILSTPENDHTVVFITFTNITVINNFASSSYHVIRTNGNTRFRYWISQNHLKATKPGKYSKTTPVGSG